MLVGLGEKENKIQTYFSSIAFSYYLIKLKFIEITFLGKRDKLFYQSFYKVHDIEIKLKKN